METQLQKYSGKNIEDNRVRIDYQKQTVHFKPISAYGYFGSLYLFIIQEIINMALLVILLTTIPFALINAIGLLLPIATYNEFQITYIARLIPVLLIPIFLMKITLFHTPKWRENKFPSYTSKTNWLTKRKKQTITPEQLQGKTHLTPLFYNIEVNYEVTGEFATQLRNINIVEHFNNNPHHWWMQIIFKKKPTTGALHLTYK